MAFKTAFSKFSTLIECFVHKLFDFFYRYYKYNIRTYFHFYLYYFFLFIALLQSAHLRKPAHTDNSFWSSVIPLYLFCLVLVLFQSFFIYYRFMGIFYSNPFFLWSLVPLYVLYSFLFFFFPEQYCLYTLHYLKYFVL